MKGLENILNEIKTDSDAAVNDIIENAEKKAEEIISAGKLEGEKCAAQIVDEARLKAQDIISRSERAAQLDFKKELLKKKQELIRDYIASAKVSLEALSEKERLKIYTKIIEKYAGGTPGEIVLTKADKDAIDADFTAFLEKNSLKVSERELADGQKGFIIVYGNIEENCTFEAMFDSMADELSDKTAALLFE